MISAIEINGIVLIWISAITIDYAIESTKYVYEAKISLIPMNVQIVSHVCTKYEHLPHPFQMNTALASIFVNSCNNWTFPFHMPSLKILHCLI